MKFDEYLKTHSCYVETIERTKYAFGGVPHIFRSDKEEVHIRLMEDEIDFIEIWIAKKEYGASKDVIYYHYVDTKWNYFISMGELTSSFIKSLMEYVRDYFDKRDKLRRLFVNNP